MSTFQLDGNELHCYEEGCHSVTLNDFALEQLKNNKIDSFTLFNLLFNWDCECNHCKEDKEVSK